MFSLNEPQRYYLCNAIVDMRKGINGLYAVVIQQMKRDPLSGEVFIFLGRRKDSVKILQWQRGGFTRYIKRLKKGVFQPLQYNEKTESYQMNWTDFLMMIEGIKPDKTILAKRYNPRQ